ncbi:Protein CBG11967 [Caenorhabditis briggsae]|uniref:F-box domain-containing protein n=2 Tax=Caenorhabditis briggsae TaxID=6238 RepID=A0AAE9E483_CAEBR|nr:Protein CBG11967 [Caenorhabditis briggsae]UMM12613.1 hypothetical protein L5515_001303 [Caenorhabditis briggsae]CAP31017.1 Protein CBG11967 [Caenorhabditis briggsae]
MSSSPLGVFGALPVDTLTTICRHLPMNDVVTVSHLDNELGDCVKRFIYRELKGLKVEINENESTIHFIHKDKRSTQLKLEGYAWEEVVANAKCVESLEMIISKGMSTSSLFSAFRKAPFCLRSLKIQIPKGGDKFPSKTYELRKRCYDLATKHRSSLRHLEMTTPDGQNAYANLNTATSSMRFTFNQAEEPAPSEEAEHNSSHTFVYTVFHAFLNVHTIKNVTLEIGSKFDPNLALQKAYQIALPYSGRPILERLTIEFGNSLKSMNEADMKQVLLRHVDECHVSTPNLQHFHCSLPHDEIDLSQEFLTLLNEPVTKSRRNPKSQPYKSTISLRTVSCQ